MKSKRFLTMRGLAVCVLLALLYSISLAAQDKSQDKSKDAKPQVSEAEQAAITKLRSAPDTAAKIQAANDFVKKFPKSTQRLAVADFVAHEISKDPDAAKQITQLEGLLTVFKEPGEADAIDPYLVDAYLKAKRVDDAFRVASAGIAKNPDDVGSLTQMAIIGIDQARQKNTKYVQQSQQYGVKAIELFEADKKPPKWDDATWQSYKTKWLPQLYQAMGLLSMMTGNKDDATSKLQKAISLNPSDPVNYVYLGGIADDEYQKLAAQYKTLMAGPVKDETLKMAQDKMDQVIDYFAHAVALSQGNPQYQQLHDQILDYVQTYYKYRHNGTTDGLQQLFDKYKKQ